MVTVLHVIASASLDWGGPSRVIREMTAALADRGHRVLVLSADGPEDQRREGSQPPFDPRVEHRLHRFDINRAPWPSSGLMVDLVRHLRGPDRVDVAHVHGLFNLPCTAAMLALRAARVPYVLRPCGMLDRFSLSQKARRKTPWWRFFDGPSASRAGAIQCSTRHEVEAVELALTEHRLSGRVVECPQGVAALPAPSPTPPRATPYLLFLGRVAEKKGLIPLVRALAADPALPDLVIVGPDERGHRAEVEREVVRLGVLHRVQWVGPIYSAHEKSSWYAHAAAFCLPSADENFGLTVVEAARLGTPLLVSPEVGLADQVRRFAAGLVAEARPEPIAAALKTLVAHRESFRAGARALGASFDWPERAAAVESLYLDSMAGTDRKAGLRASRGR